MSTFSAYRVLQANQAQSRGSGWMFVNLVCFSESFASYILPVNPNINTGAQCFVAIFVEKTRLVYFSGLKFRNYGFFYV